MFRFPSSLLLFLLLHLVFFSQAQARRPEPSPEPLREEIEGMMVSFRLDAAQAKVERLRAVGYPGYAAYYQGNLMVYRHLARMDAASFQGFQQQFSSLLDEIDQMPDGSQLKRVMLGELHCKRALLEFLHHNYLTAAHHGRLGRQHINQNARRFPEETSQLKMLGLFNVMLGAVPSRYQWLTNILGFGGDLNQGIEQLRKAAAQGQLLTQEAEILLYHVEKSILNRSEDALARLRKAREQRGPNLVMDYMLATGLMSTKQNEAALQLLYRRDLYSNSDVFFTPFWDYQLGKAYYFQGDLARARRYLARFIRDYQGTMFRTDAHFRMGMALTLSGHYELGQPFFQAVAEGQSDQFDEDAYARHMAGRFAAQPPTETVQQLFRVRNFFDGGYFDRAIALLQGMDQAALSTDDRAEWHYRYARILHSQGKLAEAHAQYQRCLDQPVDRDHRYMHAYGAFFQGGIALRRGNPSRARQLYQQVLRYDEYFYQDGLENRCKAALAGL